MTWVSYGCILSVSSMRGVTFQSGLFVSASLPSGLVQFSFGLFIWIVRGRVHIEHGLVR